MRGMFETFLKLIWCHLLGDYVLQIDYIAKSKGSNMYHLLVHCILYCLPFYIAFGLNKQLLAIFIFHVVIDLLKAKYRKINYITDQVLHYCCMFLVYLFF